ncbi:MAG: SAM-dependent DNA methyltransferase [Nitrospinae bacterium]|nr:SAM-dependent DNA methyltransferase [Nitrospinota bacterium]
MKAHRKIEFGDFQTPHDLAGRAARIVKNLGVRPSTIIEPTCGEGSFIAAACENFPNAKVIMGLEINPEYFKNVSERKNTLHFKHVLDLRRENFFTFNWAGAISSFDDPLLIIGNPPWVTASELGLLKSGNLPVKSNFQNRSGFEAISGKSNFDIAEWMLIHLLEQVKNRNATLAMLVKTSVARKVLLHSWKTGLPISHAQIYVFDANKYFSVSVEACLFVCQSSNKSPSITCDVLDFENPDKPGKTIGFHHDALLANYNSFKKVKRLLLASNHKPLYKWRSGIKHDCSAVMELSLRGFRFINGLQEQVEIEPDYLYPLLKSSDIANQRTIFPDKVVLVTQTQTGDDTSLIRHRAPKTWKYLCKHGRALDGRGSSIYKKRPRFSMFGIGDYTFSPWKVGISAFYKKLDFSVIGPYRGKPVVMDDTCYMLPCKTRDEAVLIAELLNSDPAKKFFESFIFWDAKRPITADILGKLDLMLLAGDLGKTQSLIKLRPDLIGEEQSELFPAASR